jgi:hypothetical protein
VLIEVSGSLKELTENEFLKFPKLDEYQQELKQCLIENTIIKETSEYVT